MGLDVDNRSLYARLLYQLRAFGPGGTEDGDRPSDIMATPRVLLRSREVHRNLSKIR